MKIHAYRAAAKLLLILVIMAIPAIAVAQQIAPPKIPHEKYTLPNGLTVILHEDHSTPIVAVNIWYHVGSKNERRGRTGFAHLFEHMMFQGSKHHDTDYFKALEAVGATDLNGTTNNDRTNYFQNVPAHALERTLWVEADRMGCLLPAMTQERLDNQREVVKNERRQGVDNQPYGLVDERMDAAMYPPHHPYSWAVIGYMDDLTAASKQDVENFFKEYYTPNNCTLVIAGDIDVAKTKAMVEKYFGPIPPGPPVGRTKEWIPELQREVRLSMDDRVPLPRLYIAWHSPARFSVGRGQPGPALPHPGAGANVAALQAARLRPEARAGRLGRQPGAGDRGQVHDHGHRGAGQDARRDRADRLGRGREGQGRAADRGRGRARPHRICSPDCCAASSASAASAARATCSPSTNLPRRHEFSGEGLRALPRRDARDGAGGGEALAARGRAVMRVTPMPKYAAGKEAAGFDRAKTPRARRGRRARRCPRCNARSSRTASKSSSPRATRFRPCS